METGFYPCTMDKANKISTVIACVVLCAPYIAGIILGVALDSWLVEGIMVLVGLLCVSPLFIVAVMALKGYILTPEGIEICRYGGGKRCIPAREIVDAAPMEPDQLKWSIRVMGASGFMGNFGYFANKRLGDYRAHLANKQPLVLIRLVSKSSGKYWVLSPDRREQFVEQANTLYKKATEEAK
jgi:hypothetical protein